MSRLAPHFASSASAVTVESAAPEAKERSAELQRLQLQPAFATTQVAMHCTLPPACHMRTRHTHLVHDRHKLSIVPLLVLQQLCRRGRPAPRPQHQQAPSCSSSCHTAIAATATAATATAATATAAAVTAAMTSFLIVKLPSVHAIGAAAILAAAAYAATATAVGRFLPWAPRIP